MTHPQFRSKLEAVGFGVFIPVFFVASGLRFDLSALFASASTVARVPLFLIAIYLARGLPAIVYVRLLPSRSVIAVVLQATSLTFVVTATQIGLQLGAVTQATAAGLVAAGLLSVVISPALALVLLRREHPDRASRSSARHRWIAGRQDCRGEPQVRHRRPDAKTSAPPTEPGGRSPNLSLLQESDELGDRVGRAGKRLNLLVWDLGEIAAEQLARAGAVVLERGGTDVSELNEYHTPVVGLSVAAHESLLLELLDQAGHRRYGESFEFRQLGDPPWPAAESAQQAGLGAR